MLFRLIEYVVVLLLAVLLLRLFWITWQQSNTKEDQAPSPERPTNPPPPNEPV